MDQLFKEFTKETKVLQDIITVYNDKCAYLNEIQSRSTAPQVTSDLTSEPKPDTNRVQVSLKYQRVDIRGQLELTQRILDKINDYYNL